MADINAPIYKCALVHTGLSTKEVRPYGFETMNIDGQREKFNNDDTVFLRRFLNGKFIFVNNPKTGFFDYDWIKAIEDSASNCDKIVLIIVRSCDGGLTFQNFWKGSFTTADGVFDLDRCKFTTDIQPDDIYKCLFDYGNEEHNILSIPYEYSVQDTGPVISYEFFSDENTQCNPTTSPSGSGWTTFWTDCDDSDPLNPISTIYIWFREYKWTNCVAGSPVPPSGAGWSLDTDDCSTTGKAKYVRVPLITPPSSPPALDVVVSTCSGGVPVNPNDFMGPTSDFWILVHDGCMTNGNSYWWNQPAPTVTTYSHCRNLHDTLGYLVNKTCGGISVVVSDFFEINPVGDAVGYSAGFNYVTTLANHVNHLMLSQKSDVLLPTATQPASSGNMSLFQLLAWLQSQFNVRWWITSANKLRIEHYSYFLNAPTEDFTVDPFKRQLKGTNVYSRIQEKRPRIEKFKFMEADNIDFVGADIRYDFECVQAYVGGIRGGRNADQYIDNSVTYNVDKITTDIEFITASPSEISKDGFVLMCTALVGSTFTLQSEVGKISGNILQNAHLSWANLHYNYHRHGRVLLEGTMNNIPETFFTAKPTKQQDKVMVKDCCGGIDDEVKSSEIIGSIITDLGEGVIDNYTKNLKNDSITFKLLY